MWQWIKDMWEGSTSGEKLLVATVAVLATFDFLGGRLLQAALGSVVALLTLWLMNREINSQFADRFEEAWDRTGGALDDIFDDE